MRLGEPLRARQLSSGRLDMQRECLQAAVHGDGRYTTASHSDAGMREILRQMTYKCDWRGRHFSQIDRWAPSSKTCSACDHKLDELSLSTRSWDCHACGVHHDRDENAALNILR